MRLGGRPLIGDERRYTYKVVRMFTIIGLAPEKVKQVNNL